MERRYKLDDPSGELVYTEMIERDIAKPLIADDLTLASPEKKKAVDGASRPMNRTRRPYGIELIKRWVRERLVADDPSLAGPGTELELESAVEAEVADMADALVQHHELLADLAYVVAKRGKRPVGR